MRADGAKIGVNATTDSDRGSHKGTLRTALQRYTLNPRGWDRERKSPRAPSPV